MSDKFDPAKYMTKLQGKDYLEVPPRVAWFRSEHPTGKISTEFITAGDYLIAQATVCDADGNLLAQGSATVRAWAKGGAPRDIEKAETAAIGRALAFAGFGTLQAGEDISEGDHLADAPRQIDTTTGEITTPPVSNGRKPIPQIDGQITVTHTKYVNRKDGKGRGMIYEADGIEVLDFTRESLRKLGDEWQVSVDQWQSADKEQAQPIKLIAPLVITYENVYSKEPPFDVAYRKAVTLSPAEAPAEQVAS